MPLPTPILDDRSYQQLRDELVRRIPVYAPEWTDHNPSDPGITLVELFAFLGENLLYRFNQIPDSTKLEFLRLLRIPLRAAVPATGMIALSTDVASGVLAPIKSQARAGKLPFETETEVLAWPLVISGMGRLLPDTGAPTGDAATFAQNAIDAVVAQAASFKKKLALDMKTAAFYVTVPLPSDPAAPGATAVDFGKAVDNALWIAVQKTDKTDFNQLYNALVNVGFVPDEQVVSMADVLPCPGTGVTTPVPQIVWQVSTGQLSAADGSPIYRELIPEGDTTRGLSQSGVVRLRLPRDVGGLGNFTIADPDLVGTGDLPPPIEDQSVAANVIFWLRAYRMDGGSLGRILWVGANAAEVIQTTTANTEFLGVGNAQPNQQYGLVNQQVIPSSLVIEVEDADGFKPWTQVDDFLASGEGDTHYVLDPEAGVVTFGNGVQGYAPQIGQRIQIGR